MTTFPLRQNHVTVHLWSHDHFWSPRDCWLIMNFHKTRNVPGLLRVSQNQRNICLLDHFWYFRPKLYINILKLYYFIKWYLKRLLLYQSGLLRVLNRLRNNGMDHFRGNNGLLDYQGAADWAARIPDAQWLRTSHQDMIRSNSWTAVNRGIDDHYEIFRLKCTRMLIPFDTVGMQTTLLIVQC